MEQTADKLRAFIVTLNKEPDPSWLDKTPDGKAKTINISFVETNLDNVFHGCWGTRNFNTKVITNEVVGELELYYWHPVLEREFTRVGAAAIQIMVDRAPENVTGQEKNAWANNPLNKKPNALDMAYPKLKVECLKNAAQGLGKLFGRDINRKRVSQPVPVLKQATDGLVEQVLKMIDAGDLGAPDRALFSGFVFDEMQEVVINERLTLKKQLK